MAKTDLGKKFEEKFKQDWKKCFPNTFLFRLKDQLAEFKETSKNPCDFFALPVPHKFFMIECKEHRGASVPFAAIRQYEYLLQYKDYLYVYPGVLIWFSEKDKVIWVSIEEMEKMVLDGKKSISVKMLEEKLYNIIEIPSVKKRVFMESDYSILKDIQK